MRTRPSSPEHQEAVARRLALLSAELAGQAPAADYSMPTEHTRVRAAPAVPVEPVPVPEPGRHASRSFLLGAGQLAVVAVLVAAALAVTTWWVVRGDPEPVAAPAGVLSTPSAWATPAASGSPSAGASASASASGDVTVDVAGRVRHPGIQVLPAGSRVVDAIEAAGGARRGVDLSSLNLARVLTDGEQVLVGRPAAVVPGGSVPSAGGPPGALVNLNTATAAELEALPEVGPVTAQSILSWRDEHGGFTSVDELLEVDGIGDATLATIRPHVTV